MSTSNYVHQANPGYYVAGEKANLISRFFTWCKSQERNRLFWLALGLAGHGCVLTPITIMMVLLAGNNIALFMTAIAAMSLTLITNLAAMPTKVTIPVFIFSILVDIGIIISCFSIGFDSSLAF